MSYTRNNIKILVPLFFVLIIDTMGFGIVFPIMGPLFLDPQHAMVPAQTSMAIRDLYYGISLTGFFLFMFLGAPFLGDLSDRFGRKKVILLCLFTIAASYLISAIGIWFSSVSLFILGRCAAGFMASSQPIAQAAIIDISLPENKTKNLAFISLASCIGFAIGPIVGGLTSSGRTDSLLSYTTPFLIAAILAAFNGLSLIFTFNETYHQTSQQPILLTKAFTVIIDIFRIRAVRWLALIVILIQLSWAIYFQFISLYLTQHFHYGPAKLGVFYGYMGVIFGFTLLVIIRSLLKVFSVQSITIIAIILQCVGVIANVFVSHPAWYWVWVLFIVTGVGLSYTTTLTLMSNGVPPEKQGWVMGVAGSMMALSWVFASFVISSSGLFASTLPFSFAGIIAVICLMLFLWHKQHTVS